MWACLPVIRPAAQLFGASVIYSAPLMPIRGTRLPVACFASLIRGTVVGSRLLRAGRSRKVA
jgi:hypothetical protein